VRLRSRRRLAVGVAVATAAVLSACAGVPRSSSPQVVQSVVQQQQAPQGVSPVPGADPRTIVQGFLSDNASDDLNHSAAKSFLTNEAKNRWQDNAQTQIIDSPQIGNLDGNKVTVTGRLVGTIDPSGMYSPSLPGDGQGGSGTLVSVPIGLQSVDPSSAATDCTVTPRPDSCQWRIDSLPSGLVIDTDQFRSYYTQYFVYFYDQAQQVLVPEPRYTVLRDPTALATWLMGQLIGQPGSALTTDLPSIPNPDQLKVDLGSVLRMDIPGASQLDAPTQYRMAQQIAITLDQVVNGTTMAITDGGRPVAISQLGGSQFTAAEFPAASTPDSSVPALYYISRGGVVDAQGKALSGGIGSGQYGFTSVALATAAGSTQLLVAGTSGRKSSSTLLVGQAGGDLRTTGITGALSRPAWVPNHDEVWVGDGARVFRSTSTGKSSQVALTAQSGTIAGRIIALRFSPEGARVALVIKADDGTSQVWIGDVVRSAASVLVSGLVAISPLGIAITDVAWNDPFKLFAIGRDISSGEGGVFEVQCDGSLWVPRGIGNLPQNPDSITGAERVVAAVSAGGTVWVQQTGGWASPSGGGTAYGTNPVYVE
jgi:hypothetical protein